MKYDAFMSDDLEGRCKVSAVLSNAGAYSHLDLGVLESVYIGIKEAFGKSAAESFVQMIAKTHLTSEKQFRQATFGLQENNWKPRAVSPARSDMYYIEQRSKFLKNHQYELPESV